MPEMTGPRTPTNFEFIIHRIINAVESTQMDEEGARRIPEDAFGDRDDLVPIAVRPDTGKPFIDLDPFLSATSTLVGLLAYEVATLRGITWEQQMQRLREAFLPPLTQDSILESFLLSVRGAAAEAEQYVDRVVYRTNLPVHNLVIVTSWADGEQDTSLVEALCAVGQLWAVQNAPDGLIISVAPKDYSRSWMSCTYRA